MGLDIDILLVRKENQQQKESFIRAFHFKRWKKLKVEMLLKRFLFTISMILQVILEIVGMKEVLILAGERSRRF